jgi:hypothetical protein
MKKALQIAILRGWDSLPEVAAGPGPEEARAGGSGDELAQLRIVDLGGCGVGLELNVRRDVERDRRSLLGVLRGTLWLGNRADREAQP